MCSASKVGLGLSDLGFRVPKTYKGPQYIPQINKSIYIYMYTYIYSLMHVFIYLLLNLFVYVYLDVYTYTYCCLYFRGFVYSTCIRLKYILYR